MALRTTYINGGAGDRYAYPYRPAYIKPMPPAEYIDPSGFGYKSPDAIALEEALKKPIAQIIETKNGNGETVKIAIDENGEVVATKKVPPNIVPIALAAAAAWFFLM